MLAIKLKQIGKKHQHTYRIVVAEKRSKMGGSFTDDLGFWNPHTNTFNINKESAAKWLKNGALPTASVHNILVKAKIVEGVKIPLHKKSKQEPATPKQEPEMPKEASSEAAPAV